MKESTYAILTELAERYPALTSMKEDILSAYDALYTCYNNEGRVYVCGNGGSASDSEHIVGELMKCFKKPRPIDKALAEKLSQEGELGLQLLEDLEGGLPAISLCGHPALTFAYLNDTNPMLTFAQRPGWNVALSLTATYSTPLFLPRASAPSITPFIV